MWVGAEQKVKVPPLHCDSRVQTICADVMTLPKHRLRALSPKVTDTYLLVLSSQCTIQLHLQRVELHGFTSSKFNYNLCVSASRIEYIYYICCWNLFRCCLAIFVCLVFMITRTKMNPQ